MFLRQSGTTCLVLLLWIIGAGSLGSADNAGSAGPADHSAVTYSVEEITRIESTDENWIGSIRYLAALPDDQLTMLDADRMQLRTFDATGTVVDSMTIVSGEGPGEIIAPSAFAIHQETGQLAFISGRTLSAHFFHANGDFDRLVPLPSRPTGIEFIGDDLIVGSLWLQSEDVLHRIHADGRRTPLLQRPDDWMKPARSGNFAHFTVTDAESVLFSFPVPYRIVEIDSAGDVIGESTGHSTFDAPFSSLENPSGPHGAEMVQGSRDIDILGSGLILNLVQDGDDRFIDVFKRDLTFLDRVDLTTSGSGLIRNLTAAGDDSFWVSTLTDSGMPVAIKYRLVDES